MVADAESARRALVAEDDDFSRAMIAAMVEGLGFLVERAVSGRDAIERARDFDPDLLVLDLDLGPGPSGWDVLVTARRDMPWAAGVILSGHEQPQVIEPRMAQLGPHTAYIVKHQIQSRETLRAAVSAAIEGTAEERYSLPSGVELSAGQAQVLRLVAYGWTNEQIAVRRGCSVRAVESLLARLYVSLGLREVDGLAPRVVATRIFHDGRLTPPERNDARR